MRVEAAIVDGRILAKAGPIKGRPGLVLAPSKKNPRQKRWQRTAEKPKKGGMDFKTAIETVPTVNIRDGSKIVGQKIDSFSGTIYLWHNKEVSKKEFMKKVAERSYKWDTAEHYL